MSSQSDTAFLREIPYTDTFFSELNPHVMRFNALLRGFPVPESTNNFTYCELGCGSGSSLLTYAMANPNAQFIGIDFNPHHINEAEQKATMLGIVNCTFIAKSFTEIDTLPHCDFIVMHGVYSWVHTDIREAIHDIIQKFLNPKGLVLISYNAYPGWHIYEPLRMMLKEYAEGLTGNPIEDGQQGIQFLEYVAERNPEYFKAVPSAHEVIKELMEQDPRYIVHEYFAEHWTPLLFREMSESMKHIGLNFAGQIPLFLNYGEICLSEEFQEFNEQVLPIDRFETFKDLFRNTMFRWDMYSPSENNQLIQLDQTHFGIIHQHDVSLHEIALPGCRVLSLNDDIHNTIMTSIEHGNSSIELLHQHTSISKTSIENALINLCITEQIRPLATAPYIALESNRYTCTKQILSLLEQAMKGNELPLPSPVSGSGILINQDTALLLFAIIKHGINDGKVWAAEWIEIHGFGNHNAINEVLDQHYSSFLLTLPFWQRMGIIHCA